MEAMNASELDIANSKESEARIISKKRRKRRLRKSKSNKGKNEYERRYEFLKRNSDRFENMRREKRCHMQKETEDEAAKVEKDLLCAVMLGDDKAVAKIQESFETEDRQRILNSFRSSYTLPYLAAASGQDKCLKILIALGADIEVKNKFGSTPLHIAAQRGHYSCLKRLLKAGAVCNIPIKSLPNIKKSYVDGATALHLAAQNNHVNCVKKLIKFGANCNAVEENGHTSLYLAMKAGHSECASILLESAPASAFLSSYDTLNTPLHFAVRNGMLECVKKLLHLGVDVNHMNNEGCSPLHLLLRNNHLKHDVKMQILKILVLDSDADIENSLPESIYKNWDSEVMAYLIAHGAKIKTLNEMNDRPILEQELIATDPDIILKKDIHFVSRLVNFMPQLPRLKSLNFRSEFILEVTPEMIKEKLYSQDMILPKNFVCKLVRCENCLYFEVLEVRLPTGNRVTVENENDAVKGLKKYVPLKQSFVDFQFERLKENFSELLSVEFECSNFGEFQLVILEFEPWCNIILMCMWYERKASTPFSLQHFCRYSIRKHMGPSNLKHLRKLHLPKRLLSYLLFEESGC